MPGVGGIGTGGERVSQQRSVEGAMKTTLRLGEGRRGAPDGGTEGNPGPRRDGRGPHRQAVPRRGDRPAVNTFPGRPSGPASQGQGCCRGDPGSTVQFFLGSAGREEMSRVSF